MLFYSICIAIVYAFYFDPRRSSIFRPKPARVLTIFGNQNMNKH